MVYADTETWWEGLSQDEKNLIKVTYQDKLGTIEVNDKFLDSIFLRCPHCRKPVAYKSMKANKL